MKWNQQLKPYQKVVLSFRSTSKVTGFQGDLKFDSGKPDGTMRKLLDVSLLKGLGWESKIDLMTGLRETYKWFLVNQGAYRTK